MGRTRPPRALRVLRAAAVGACLMIAVLAVAGSASASQPARAAKSCGTVEGKTRDGTAWRATVHVKRGSAACRTARWVARKIVTGDARHHDGGFGYNSYYVVGPWRGGMSTGGWGATNQRSGAYIGGRVLL